MLVLLLTSLLPHGISMTFRIGAFLLAYYIPSLWLLSVASLTVILSPILGVVYERENLFLLSFSIYSL